MDKLRLWLLQYYRNITNSIAFYPILISIGMTLLAVIFIFSEASGLSRYIDEYAPFLLIKNIDTARNILTTMIGGLVSLMVFSFSMVMILLNQAANNLTPRVLPSLISNRNHQLVLGFYIGTILFCIIAIVNVVPEFNNFGIPSATVLFGIFLSICCFGLFVYFIHSISESIKVSNILHHVFERTRQQLDHLEDNQPTIVKKDDFNNWKSCRSKRSGYLSTIDSSRLIAIAKKENTIIRISQPLGAYVPFEHEVFQVESEIPPNRVEDIRHCLLIDNGDVAANSYTEGFRHITEIAVKAMSPGINDPGTAINAINYMADLYAIRLRHFDQEQQHDDTDQLRLIITPIPFEDLLYANMASLRQYCKSDVIVMRKLLEMLLHLLSIRGISDKSYREVIRQELQTLMNDAEKHLSNPRDFAQLQMTLRQFSDQREGADAIVRAML